MRVCFALFLEADCFQATDALTIKKIPVNEQDDENIPIARTSTQQPMFENKDTESKVEVETVKEAVIEENVDINQNDQLETDKGAEASDV